MNKRLTKEERRRWEMRRRARIRRRRRRIAKRLVLLMLLLAVIGFGYIQIRNLNVDSENNDKIAQNTTEEQSDIDDYVEAGVDSTYINYIRKLIDLADENSDYKTIIDHIEEYPTDILDLLVNNPETLDFANGYLSHKQTSKITLTKPSNGEIPLYQQWDSRWGYDEYGDNIIAINGCGPTCLSMVAVGLLGDTSLNPKYIAQFSEKHEYFDEASGATRWALMSTGAKQLGLTVYGLGLDDKEAIISHLENGHPIIASVGPGDFTTQGHYIVLTAIDEDEKVTVNDPNNIARSNKKWDLDSIIEQMKGLWAFSE